MLQKTATVSFLLFVLTVSVSAALPIVLQPNASAYSAAELAELNAGIGSLQSLLADPTPGSQKALGEYRWTTSLEFAAYTEGTLSGRGYETRLVAQAGWPDGRHVWVLVGVRLTSGRTAWVPVEATPRAGEKQRSLGSIPLRTGAGGQPEFDLAYTRFTDELSLPPNALPVPSISFAPAETPPTVPVTFLTAGSRDPDGEIVRYVWDFGDGTEGEGQKASHAYAQVGRYKVRLSVTDSRGTTAVAEGWILVVASSAEWEERPPVSPPGPCIPCGGG